MSHSLFVVVAKICLTVWQTGCLQWQLYSDKNFVKHTHTVIVVLVPSWYPSNNLLWHLLRVAYGIFKLCWWPTTTRVEGNELAVWYGMIHSMYDQWPVVLSCSHFLVPMWKPRCRRRLQATLHCMWHARLQTMQDSVQDSMTVCNVLFIWINAPFSKFKPILIPTRLKLLRLLILIARPEDFLTRTSSIWFQFGFCTKFPWLGTSSKPGSLLHHHGGDWACYAGKAGLHLRHCAQGVDFASLSGTEPNLPPQFPKAGNMWRRFWRRRTCFQLSRLLPRIGWWLDSGYQGVRIEGVTEAGCKCSRKNPKISRSSPMSPS